MCLRRVATLQPRPLPRRRVSSLDEREEIEGEDAAATTVPSRSVGPCTSTLEDLWGRLRHASSLKTSWRCRDMSWARCVRGILRVDAMQTAHSHTLALAAGMQRVHERPQALQDRQRRPTGNPHVPVARVDVVALHFDDCFPQIFFFVYLDVCTTKYPVKSHSDQEVRLKMGRLRRKDPRLQPECFGAHGGTSHAAPCSRPSGG